MAKRNMVRLIAPAGTDEANYGEERFRVDNNGFVDVPKEAAEDLIKKGGFKLPPEKDDDDLPEGHVRVYHAEATNVSFAGETYETDGDGGISVPAHAVKDLEAHGFSTTAPKA